MGSASRNTCVVLSSCQAGRSIVATAWASTTGGTPIPSDVPEGSLPVGARIDQVDKARAALSAHRGAWGWPDAPRRVSSGDLLPERVLAGDGHARRHLVDEVYLPLMAVRGTLLETLGAWFEQGSSIEGTARALFVHPNTVRYRLRQVTDVTGWSPTRPRAAFTLQLALILGRQSGRTER